MAVFGQSEMFVLAIEARVEVEFGGFRGQFIETISLRYFARFVERVVDLVVERPDFVI